MALPDNPLTLARQLTRWFEREKRDLPWRIDRSPYRVWLSEVMLQQTRVAVVEDYFRRFVLRFADVRSLAAASEDEVLALWSGLGYYSRGRNLHRAARVVVEQHGGAFPHTAAALRLLPGVGPYTAAAIASLAFSERVAVVDGNVGRVLSRLCDDDRPIDLPAGKHALSETAQLLVDHHSKPQQVNEGLMELGALVCTPTSPACGACPWRIACRARKTGTIADRPRKAPKRARTALDVAAVVLVGRQCGRVWLERREARGLFGGMFEPPSSRLVDSAAAGVEASWRQLLRERGFAAPERMPPPAVVARTLTHRELRFFVATIVVDAAPDDARFYGREALSSVGISSAVRAVLDVAWPVGNATHPQRAASKRSGLVSGKLPKATKSSAVVRAGRPPLAARR